MFLFSVVAIAVAAAVGVFRSSWASRATAMREFSVTLRSTDSRTTFVTAPSVSEAAAKVERQYPGYEVAYLGDARAIGRCDGCKGPVFSNEPVATWPDGTIRHVVCVEPRDDGEAEN